VAEDFTLTTAEVVPEVTTATYRLVFLSLDWERSTILIRLRGEHGETKSFTYGGTDPAVTQADRDAALALMVGLNKANLSIKSLQRRVLERLIADGKLSGSITGAPD
jgi:hypothetical protein